jgi:hypothetical protein
MPNHLQEPFHSRAYSFPLHFPLGTVKAFKFIAKNQFILPFMDLVMVFSRVAYQQNLQSGLSYHF